MYSYESGSKCDEIERLVWEELECRLNGFIQGLGFE